MGILEKDYQKVDEIGDILKEIKSSFSSQDGVKSVNIQLDNSMHSQSQEKHNVKLASIVSPGLKIRPMNWHRSTASHKFSRLRTCSFDERVHLDNGHKTNKTTDGGMHNDESPMLLSMCSFSPGTYDDDDSSDIRHISGHQFFVSLLDESEEDNLNSEGSKDDLEVRSMPTFILETENPNPAEPRYGHILTKPLMDALRSNLPLTIMEQNYWLKYSLLRDGASFYNMLQRIKCSNRTIITIETMEGEIFGSFTSDIWKLNPNFYGSGESFLWRKKNDDEVEVFPWTTKNFFIQICRDDLIGLGGGDNVNSLTSQQEQNSSSNNISCAGFGLAIDSDLSRGASVPCGTFDNPSLVQSSSDGIFEIYNIEVWTLTRCNQIAAAEKLEAHKHFLSAFQ